MAKMNKEIVFVLLLVGGLLLPAVLAGQWWMFGVFMTFFVCFGIWEWIAVVKTKQSVSQKFWEWSKTHKVVAWIYLASMLIAWLALLWHFAGKYLLGGN